VKSLGQKDGERLRGPTPSALRDSTCLHLVSEASLWMGRDADRFDEVSF
jgi:hypothetical protein